MRQGESGVPRVLPQKKLPANCRASRADQQAPTRAPNYSTVFFNQRRIRRMNATDNALEVCPDCNGEKGIWYPYITHSETPVGSDTWVPCATCEGTGFVSKEKL